MVFSNVNKKTAGADFNYFAKTTVSSASFTANPDQVISFNTQGLIFINEGTSNIVEYSFNGNTVHGQLDSNAGSVTKILTFDNRVVSLIWFRLTSGSAGNVSVQAWATK